VKSGSRKETVVQIALPGLAPVVLSMPPLTAGMAANLALAVTLAVELGVSPDVLPSRLAGWTPSAQRGEERRIGAQVYYVDCYNANPASMADTLDFFAARFAEMPRLYVLASMRELGSFSAAAHEKIGNALRLAGDDAAAFIGEAREHFQRGAVAAGNAPERLHAFSHTEDARELVRGFAGAILLKGSRAYALETLLPETGGTTEAEGIAC